LEKHRRKKNNKEYLQDSKVAGRLEAKRRKNIKKAFGRF
jgi:hypothetical protein